MKRIIERFLLPLGLAGPAARQFFADRVTVFEMEPSWRGAAEAQGLLSSAFLGF